MECQRNSWIQTRSNFQSHVNRSGERRDECSSFIDWSWFDFVDGEAWNRFVDMIIIANENTFVNWVPTLNCQKKKDALGKISWIKWWLNNCRENYIFCSNSSPLICNLSTFLEYFLTVYSYNNPKKKKKKVILLQRIRETTFHSMYSNKWISFIQSTLKSFHWIFHLLTGTDATHAEHIDKIKTREYVGLLENIYFVPGELGIGLVEGYDSMGFEMSKPRLRAELERDLQGYLSFYFLLHFWFTIF